MKLSDLPDGEYFIFDKHRYKKIKKVPRHQDAWSCMDDDGRHRPFRGDIDVLHCQQKGD